MTKILASSLAVGLSIAAQVEATVPNCFTDINVVKGVFVIRPKSQSSTDERRAVLQRIEDLGLSVTGIGPADSWNAQPMRAVELSSNDQTAIVRGLQSLKEAEALEGVECSRINTIQ